MSTLQTETDAIRRLASADQHFRITQYLIAGLVAALFLFAAFRLIAMEANFERQRQDIINTAAGLARESRTRDEEERRYITCLLLVPIAERSEQAQHNCFQFADLPGGLDERNFAPIDPDAVGSEAPPTDAPS